MNRASQWIWQVMLLAAVSLGTPQAWAILDIYVQDDLPVYDKPEAGSREVSRLTRGDRLVISPKIYGAYRKVLVTYGGKRQGGFIKISQIRRSYIKDRDEEELAKQRIYNRDYGLGLSLIASHMRQDGRKFTTGAADTYDISPLTSTTFFFSIFSDVPWSNTMMLRPYLSFRSTKFKGEAELVGSINPLRPAQVTLEQSFLGIGVLAKMYDGPRDTFWWGGGIEVGSGDKSNLIIDDGIPLKVEGEKPLYVLLYGSIGWDVPAPGAFWLVPDLRLGIVPNNDPIILYLEAFVSVAYSLR